MNKPENIEKLDNGTLEVKLKSDSDFGNYYCKFLLSSTVHPSVNHTVVKLSPPEIVSLLAENNKTVVGILKCYLGWKIFSQKVPLCQK